MSHLFVVTIPKEFVYGKEKDRGSNAPKSGLQLDDIAAASDKKFEEAQEFNKNVADSFPRSASMDSFAGWQSRAEIFTTARESVPRLIEKVLDVPSFFINETKGSINILSQLDSVDGKTQQITFTSRITTEKLLKVLFEIGIGVVIGSLQVLPISLSFGNQGEEHENEATKEEENMFMASVRDRELLQTMVSAVYVQSQFSFDYLVMISMAGIIAAIGLGIGSDVIIVASMLVSPMMGPILGMCFGTVIREKQLILTSCRNEILSIIVCIVVGFMCGIVITVCADYMRHFSPNGEYPTPQMLGRGDYSNLVVGVGIAIPSGVGAALSVTGSNTPGLVGVAISASLLPPSVNAGVLLSYAAFSAVFGVDHDDDLSVSDYVEKAFVSIILTLVNVACILIFAILVFMIKEIAPLPGKSNFWHNLHDNLKYSHVEEEPSATTRRREQIEELMKRKHPNFCMGNQIYDYSDTYLGELAMAHPSVVLSRRGSLTGVFSHAHSASRRASMNTHTLSNLNYIPGARNNISIQQIFKSETGLHGTVKSYQ